MLEAIERLTQADANALIAADDVSLRAWGFRRGFALTTEKPQEEASAARRAGAGQEKSEFVLLHIAASVSRGIDDSAVLTLVKKLPNNADPNLIRYGVVRSSGSRVSQRV